MRRETAFSYRCGACGRCCHNKVITLAPYEVIRIARATRLSTASVIDRYTLRRGSVLRFDDDGSCSALRGAMCSIHSGRPLACRLYPLGIERSAEGERFIRLEPAEGSAGIYGENGTVEGFLAHQGAEPYLDAVAIYERLIAVFQARLEQVADFEKIEPREFYRRAIREALAESNYDPNPLIDALFDVDRIVGRFDDESAQIEAHVRVLEAMIQTESNAQRIAAASALLAVSLGHPPAAARYSPLTCMDKK